MASTPLPRLPVLMFSGGLSSALCAVLLHKQGIRPILLHTDTLFESPDTYQFMGAVAAYLGTTITFVSDGRTPEQLFWQEHFLGNDLFPVCSRTLKGKQAELWIMEQRIAGREPVVYVGLGPSERRRVIKVRRQYEHMGVEPVQVVFPLLNEKALNLSQETRDMLLEKVSWVPFGFQDQVSFNKVLLSYFQAIGIEPPSAYSLGFSHSNCSNQCVRAGLGHWYNAYYRDHPAFDAAKMREYRFAAEVYPKTRKGAGSPAIDSRGFPTTTFNKRGGKPFSLLEMEQFIQQGWEPGDKWKDDRPCLCVI